MEDQNNKISFVEFDSKKVLNAFKNYGPTIYVICTIFGYVFLHKYYSRFGIQITNYLDVTEYITMPLVLLEAHLYSWKIVLGFYIAFLGVGVIFVDSNKFSNYFKRNFLIIITPISVALIGGLGSLIKLGFGWSTIPLILIQLFIVYFANAFLIGEKLDRTILIYSFIVLVGGAMNNLEVKSPVGNENFDISLTTDKLGYSTKLGDYLIGTTKSHMFIYSNSDSTVNVIKRADIESFWISSSDKEVQED